MGTRIDLGDFRTPGVLVYAGRDRGKAVRRRLNLDVIDATPGVIEVHVPEDVFSVTPSFFLGMFGPSIRALTSEGFARHYRFTGKSIAQTIADAIPEALRTTSPL